MNYQEKQEIVLKAKIEALELLAYSKEIQISNTLLMFIQNEIQKLKLELEKIYIN